MSQSEGAAFVADYRIDELAREAGTTVRNVRAYQDRGLIPPPRREGRVGLYTDAHLARLRLVGRLLDRGYSLSNVAELIAAWEQGQNVGELLGLEAAISAPWSTEAPTSMSIAELVQLFGDALTPRTLLEAARLGVLEPDGLRFRVNAPSLLQVGAELVAAGVPLEPVLALGHELRQHMDDVALRFVQIVETHVIDPLGEPVPPAEVPRLAELIARLRPLAQAVVDAELGRAMERHVQASFGERVDRLIGAIASSRDEAS